LPALLSCADDLSYVGIDIAQTMVADATAFNSEAVAAGLASFQLASAEALPFADQDFDRVFAVNVIYFWPEPARALTEIRRVLRPGGFSVVATVVSGPGETPPAFARAEFGFHRRDRETVATLHREAGFQDTELDDFEEMIMLPGGTPRKRRYAIFVARP
jgi:SAM-dependent methyltransferase